MTPAQKRLAAIYAAIGTPESEIRKALGLPALPAKMKHGTRGGFTRGCRCPSCVDANKAYLRDYNAKTKARSRERITKAEALFMPPRAVELPEEPIFAPALEMPPVPVPPPAPAPAGWQRQCTAVDAATGLRCGLVGRHETHRTARGPFVTVAAPGQTHFAHKAELERIAFADGGAVESPTHRATVREGKRAHAGHITADDRSVKHNEKAHGEAA